MFLDIDGAIVFLPLTNGWRESRILADLFHNPLHPAEEMWGEVPIGEASKNYGGVGPAYSQLFDEEQS